MKKCSYLLITYGKNILATMKIIEKYLFYEGAFEKRNIFKIPNNYSTYASNDAKNVF